MADPSPGGRGAPGSAADQRAVLATLAVSALMVMYVETMIVPAIPRFSTFFDGAAVSLVAWILTSYLLVGVVATPIVAKLGDIYGKKRVLLAVLAVYAAAVSVAGFTPDIASAAGISRGNAIYVLIGVRAIQGVGVGIFPLAFALVGEVFPPERVAVAQGAIASMFAVGAALGLFGGAYITQTFGWQTTYHSIVPLALAAPVVVWYRLKESRYRHEVRLDVPGAILLGATLGAFLVGVSQGPDWGWGNWSAFRVVGIPLGTPEFLLIALVLFAGFLYLEPRSANPIVNFAKMRERNVVIANISGVFAAACMFVFFVTSQILLQVPTAYGGLGLNTFDAGLASLPCSLAMLALGPVMGRAVSRQGPKPVMLVGGGLVFVGGLSYALFNRTVPEAILDSIPILLGVIACFIAMTNIVVLGSRKEEAGILTGMNQTFRNIGAALGPVIASTFLSSFAAAGLVGQLPVPGQPGQTVGIYRNFPAVAAYQYAFLAVAAMGALIALLSVYLRNYRYSATGVREDAPSPAAVPRPALPTPEVSVSRP